MYKVTITVNVDEDDPQDARWAALEAVTSGDVDVDSLDVEKIE